MQTPTLGRRAAFWTTALTAALALWTSAAPSVVYPLYAAEWGLTPVVTTTLFAVYPLALVAVLLLLGDLGDVIGRRAAIVAGLSASAAGTLLFALAPGIGVVFAGRVLMGIGVGLSLGSATAAMAEFADPAERSRTGAVTAASTAGGLTVATLVGGALAGRAPDPLHLGFWVLLAVLAIGIVLASMLPRSAAGGGGWRPRLPHPPRELRGIVLVAALAVATAYATGAVVLSLGADLVTALLGAAADPFASGAAIAVSSVTIGVVALATRGIPPRITLPVGAAGTVAGLALLVAAAAAGSLPLVIAGMVIGGAGYSLEFAGGVGLASTRAPAQHRVAVLSTVYLAGYAIQGALAVALGAIATGSGLTTAFAVGLCVVAVLALVGALVSRPLTALRRSDGIDPEPEGAPA